MNRKNSNEQRYFNVLRFGTFGVSVFLWLLSILWSADGFGIKLEGWKIAGYGLGICVTIVQLVFNRGTMNPTLYFGGLAAYLYGIATNVIGLVSITGTDFTSWNSDPIDTVFSLALILALAFVVEVLPESLLLWAVNPEQGSPGDFLSSLFRGSGLDTGNKPQKRPNMSDFREIGSVLGQTRSFNEPTNRNRTNKQTNQPTNPFTRLNWSEIPEKKKQILGYAKNHLERTGQIPGPTQVSRKLYGSSKNKGFVSATFKEYGVS